MPSSWALCTSILILCILSAARSAGIIDVHLIPHSHCDPGWRKTFEGYYQEKVSDILTNVVAELLKNSTRTFIWSEVSLFSRWYEEQNQEQRANVHKLVENKQFEFVGGGWVQHDEANAHYHQIIDQITVGHRYLWETFGVKPNIAWQVDPFGHSSLTPTILAQAGFDAVVLNRIHYAAKKQFRDNRHLEFVWHSHTRPELKLLAHVLSLSYSSSYDFEMSDLPPDIAKEGNYFAKKYIGDAAHLYGTNVIMLPWGDDFRFVAAERQFKNMDLLLDYVSAHPELNVRVQYSTLSRYFEALQRTEAQFPSYIGDFFPYADLESSYWTGFYTTQPALKLYSRQVDAVIRSADVALTLANYHASIPALNDRVDFNTDLHSATMAVARQEAALIMHHDAITGTATSPVIYDYVRRLNQAYNSAKEVLSDALSVLLNGRRGRPHLDGEISVLDFTFKKEHIIVLHNSLAWTREQFYKLTVRTLNDIRVTDSKDQVVPHQLIPSDPTHSNQQYHLYFRVGVGPLALETYYLTSTEGSVNTPVVEVYNSKSTTNVDFRFSTQSKTFESDKAAIENEVISVNFSAINGMIERAVNKVTGESIDVMQDLLAYTNSLKSGAYLMTTAGPATSIVDGFLLVIFKGAHVQEARVMMNNGMEWHYRVYSGIESLAHVIEQDYTVKADSASEVIVRYNTNIDDEYFYTDNGIEMLQRKKTDSVPEHNYYPLISMAYLQSEQTNQRFTIMNQHAMGVTSLTPGTLELMLHRNLPNDDERGLDEGTNDGTTVRATLWSLWHSNAASELVARQLSTMLNNPLQALTTKDRAFETQVSVSTWKESFASRYHPIKDALPINVHMATLQYWPDENNILLRLMNTAQHAQSKQTVNIQHLFDMDNIQVLEEKSLDSTGTVKDERMSWKSSGLSELSKIKDVSVNTETVPNNKVHDQISLGPNEIRTFTVQFGATTDTRQDNGVKPVKVTTNRVKVELPTNMHFNSNQGLFLVYLIAFAMLAVLISSLWSTQSRPRTDKDNKQH